MWLSTIKFCHFNFIVNLVFFYYNMTLSLPRCLVWWLLVEIFYFHWIHRMVLSLLLNCHDRVVNFFSNGFCSHVAACLHWVYQYFFLAWANANAFEKLYTALVFYILSFFSFFFFFICIDFMPSNFDFLVSVLPIFLWAFILHFAGVIRKKNYRKKWWKKEVTREKKKKTEKKSRDTKIACSQMNDKRLKHK